MYKALFLLLILISTPLFVLGGPAQKGCGFVGQPPCSEVGDVSDPNFVGVQSDKNAPISTDTITGVILNLVNWLSWLVGVASVVMGLYSGLLFITASDDANKIETAKKTVIYALIGVAVAILSFSIVKITWSLIGME